MVYWLAGGTIYNHQEWIWLFCITFSEKKKRSQMCICIATVRIKNKKKSSPSRWLRPCDKMVALITMLFQQGAPGILAEAKIYIPLPYLVNTATLLTIKPTDFKKTPKFLTLPAVTICNVAVYIYYIFMCMRVLLCTILARTF